MDHGLSIQPPTQQELKRRYHLPSQEETTQSLQLIDQWKDNIKALKLEISSAEQASDARREALKNELEAKISELRIEYEVLDKNEQQQRRSQVEGPLMRLEDLEKRLNLEQEFVAGIRKLPEEILVEILHYYLENRLPSHRLASVCRRWKALLLRIPTFWRTLKAYSVLPSATERAVKELERRIELSGSTLLDVTLSIYSGTEGSSKYDLFKLIAQTGIERWRSLTLQSSSSWIVQDASDSLEGIFKGNFSSLRTLEREQFGYNYSGTDDFSPIYETIVQSKPPIQELVIRGLDLPSTLAPSIFHRITRLESTAVTFTKLQHLNNLEYLHITLIGHNDTASFSATSSLPAHVIFNQGTTLNQLNSLQRQKVQEFVVPHVMASDFDGIVDFPELTSLTIIRDGFESIRRISAPNLTKLEVKIPAQSNSSRKGQSSIVTSLIRETPVDIMIKPTTLIMDLGLNTTSIIAIIQHWPQLQHLTLGFGGEFAWKGAFAKAFRKKNPLCLELITLRLDSRSPDFKDNMDQWKAIAVSIISMRKGTPLRSIEWRHDGGEWQKALTDSDVV